MAIGLFYESSGSPSTSTDANSSRNIHEISAQMSERNNSHVTPTPSNTGVRPQTIILNDSESENDNGVVVEEAERSSQSESEDPVFNTNARSKY